MYIDRRTATWRELHEEKERMDALYAAGKLGPAAYKLSLEILGYRPREAKEELEGLRNAR